LEGARVHQNKNRVSQSSVNDQSHYLNSLGAPPSAGFDPSIATHLIGSGLPNFMPGQAMSGQGMPGQSVPEQSAYNDTMASISNRTSRSSSLMQPASSLAENRRSLSSLEHISSRTSFDGSSEFAPGGLPAYSMPTSVQSAGPLGNHSYGFSNQATNGEMGSNQAVTASDAANGMFGRPNMPNGQGQDMSWNGAYPTSNPGYPMYQAGQVGGNNQAIKTETNLINNGMPGTAENADGNAEGADVFTGLYSNSSTFASNHLFDGWDIGDPFEHKAGALVSFCFPGATAQPTTDELKLKAVLTPDNVRHFFKLFGNFQGHWPMIHMPTFNPIEAYDGLLLTMTTIGAIYSDRLDLHTQRWFMEQVQKAVQRNSRVYNGQVQNAYAGLDSNHSDIEEIQALLILQIVFTWHGNDAQRSSSRDNFFRLASIARQHGLLQPISPEQPGFSILHYEGKRFEESDRAMWQWSTWVEQEKRLRTMLLAYLLDNALVIYFNCQPQFDWQEIKLQLPSDDAAWEARTAVDCMDALGLNGKSAQEVRNTTGSRRPKQIPFVSCVKALLNQTTEFKERSTNVYGKFILIHALHTLIWTAQRQASSSVAAAATFGNLSGSGPSTPISQNDWVTMDGVGTLSNTTSGRATPEMVGQHSAQHHQAIHQLTNAVEKWKRNWDHDMDLQYPATTTPGGTRIPPRAGFCRDGVHFYFLAMLFLNSNRAIDSQIPADHRFTFVMQKLKAIRNYVKNDAHAHGKGIGSVADIQEEYGVEDLTLDMKLLFAPLELNDTEGTANVPPQ
jgi:Fungal specific transcription factor domain